MKTKFFVFDGPNGAGKTELTLLISEKLRSEGISVYQTREPTARFGKTSVTEAAYAGESLAIRIADDRRLHITEDILPALERGETVICDRYICSSLVYQKDDGLSEERIWELNHDIPSPELTILLTATPTDLAARLAARKFKSRFEESMSREEEIALYDEAARSIEKRGWKTLRWNTSDFSIDECVRLLASFCR